MNKKILIGLLVVAAFIVNDLFVIGVLRDQPIVGGLVHNVQEIFSAGIKAGSSAVEVINSSGQWVYGILTSESATFSGSSTFSGAVSASGAVTFSGVPKVEATASSTMQIGDSGAGVGAGCILLGDSGGATSTPVYITATGETITATTTKPDICATAQ